MTRRLGLEELLEEKKKRLELERPYLAKDRDAWVNSVKTLFDKIATWLKPLADKNYLRIDRRKMILREQALGDYTIERMSVW